VVLGERSVISQGTFLCTASHDYRQQDFPLTQAPIVIEKGAWVAARAIVLMGVTIGENSVIGARSVVTRTVPANMICAGNPAR
jgi:putative colanic acid biosynthesis acetyltransferase WcaF